jgi:hypothetical protein
MIIFKTIRYTQPYSEKNKGAWQNLFLVMQHMQNQK